MKAMLTVITSVVIDTAPIWVGYRNVTPLEQPPQRAASSCDCLCVTSKRETMSPGDPVVSQPFSTRELYDRACEAIADHCFFHRAERCRRYSAQGPDFPILSSSSNWCFAKMS